MTPSIFAAVDWYLVLYAAGMGAVMSLLITWRERNAQRSRNLPLSSWASLIPDTLIASLSGTFAALMLAARFPALRTFEGIGFVSAVAGVVGPAVWDWIRVNGKDTLFEWAGSMATGGLKKLAEAAAKRKGGPPDDQQNKPAPPDDSTPTL
ncbi:hypothetical protein [Deinococcus sp. QL22]|uniref:hypothetical protein n=1 Tax=Deinococcus sp. QL22 TaxID=2939437 RepID=UPI00201758B5|nr:hypothetical protein [Deinococcus sp. QL22]UQN05431.1 hypothetical protein M1R55_11155 [Deinococcus sp. QL22]